MSTTMWKYISTMEIVLGILTVTFSIGVSYTGPCVPQVKSGLLGAISGCTELVFYKMPLLFN